MDKGTKERLGEIRRALNTALMKSWAKPQKAKYAEARMKKPQAFYWMTRFR